MPQGTPLADADRNDASLASIPFVRRLVDGIAGVLELAHTVGLSHGAVEQQSIVIGRDGTPVLVGLGIGVNGFSHDQADLALLAINLLAKEPWSEPAPDNRFARAQQLPEHLANYTQRISGVLTRATDPDPSSHSPIAEFAEALRRGCPIFRRGPRAGRARRNLVAKHRVGETAGREGRGVRTGVRSARQPQPSSPRWPAGRYEGRAVGSRLRVISPGHVRRRAGGFPRSSLPRHPGTSCHRSSSEGLPEEFIDAIAPQFEVKPVKKGVPPMLVLIVGLVGIAFLLAVARMATSDHRQLAARLQKRLDRRTIREGRERAGPDAASAPAAVGKRSAARSSLPPYHAATRPPRNASPAPTVSTTSIGQAGSSITASPRTSTAPSEPQVMIVAFRSNRSLSMDAAAAMAWRSVIEDGAGPLLRGDSQLTRQ